MVVMSFMLDSQSIGVGGGGATGSIAATAGGATFRNNRRYASH